MCVSLSNTHTYAFVCFAFFLFFAQYFLCECLSSSNVYCACIAARDDLPIIHVHTHRQTEALPKYYMHTHTHTHPRTCTHPHTLMPTSVRPDSLSLIHSARFTFKKTSSRRFHLTFSRGFLRSGRLCEYCASLMWALTF